MAMLLVQSQTPGLLTINGQFCGRVDEAAHTYMTHRDERAYLSFCPFDDAFLPLTREIHIAGDQLLSPAQGLYALMWPENICQLELRPSMRIPSPLTDSTYALPTGAYDVSKRPLNTDHMLVTGRTDTGEFACICDQSMNALDTLYARRLTWDTPEVVQAFKEAGDFVGHASLCAYRLTPAGFSALTCQNVWASGAPRWPTTPIQTLRAYLEALIFGANEEASQYLASPDRHTALGHFNRVIELRFPLTHAPEHLPLALGMLTVVSPTLARVQAVCARARPQRHAQGAYKLEEIEILS